MREFVFLLFVLTVSRSAVGNIPRKSCSDCTALHSCDAAGILLKKKEATADDKLRQAFCGFDDAKKPMVCCSELSSLESISTVPGSESIEDHPNLHLLPDGCGMINEERILGGRFVGLYQFPWMVLISFRTHSGLEFKCCGSLINERYVLTAAHCISNLTLAGVRVGEFDFATTSDCQGEPPHLICETHVQDLRVEETIAHPDYHGQPRVSNDIGLLRLKKPVNFTFKNAGTICLPVTKELQDRKVAGLLATVAGWGYLKKGYMNTQLHAVELPIRTKEDCSQAYNMSRSLWASYDLVNKLCAGDRGRGTCSGDSGAPLMVKGAYKNLGQRLIQYGILSYGRVVCGTEIPSVYTDVSKYVKWILDNVKP